jgi:glucosyl-3-phosphoglycerate synthase
MPDVLPDPRAQAWFETHTYSGEVDASGLAAIKAGAGLRISVCLPALNEEETVGAICTLIKDRLMPPHGVVDELLVVDSGSDDGTAEAATAAGATLVRSHAGTDAVVSQGAGKGAALRKSLASATGDIVVWLDSDTKNFSEHFVTRLVAPLLAEPELKLVKAFYDRPLVASDVLLEEGGGRVTELVVRPLLNLYYPELAGVIQPLAGECALRRDAVMQLPLLAGYGVEIALLIDLVERWGLGALAQADLGVRIHRNRDLPELASMALEILRSMLQRFEDLGLLKSAMPLGRRPFARFRGRELHVEQAAELFELPPLAPSR